MSIAVDTNVLVRFLTWDVPEQADLAAGIIESGETIAISTVVLCELAWVLKRAYRYRSSDIAGAIERIVTSRNVEVDRPAAEAGLAMLARGGDFADGVVWHDARRARCRQIATFDRNFAELIGEGDALLLGA